MYLLTVYSCLLRHQLIRACLHLLLTADDAQRDTWLAAKQQLRNYNIDAVGDACRFLQNFYVIRQPLQEVWTMFTQVSARSRENRLFNDKTVAKIKETLGNSAFAQFLSLRPASGCPGAYLSIVKQPRLGHVNMCRH